MGKTSSIRTDNNTAVRVDLPDTTDCEQKTRKVNHDMDKLASKVYGEVLLSNLIYSVTSERRMQRRDERWSEMVKDGP